MKGCLTKYVVKGSSRPKWRYRLYTGKNEDGKKQFEGRAAFEKQADAAFAMRQHLEELRTRSTGGNAATPINLGPWLEKWLDTYAVDRCQPKTLERYRQFAIYLMKTPDGNASALAQTPLPDVTHMQIESALYSLLKAKGKRREHISARTVRHVGGLLSVALNKAFRLELVQVNPMLRIELPSVQPKEARSLTPLEIQGLRQVCRGDWTFAFVEVALATAARRGELLAVQWPDLDWATRTLTISKSLEQTKAGLRVKRPKNEKMRSFRLSQSAMVALKFLCDQQKEYRRSFSGDYQDNDLIFCEADGSYYEPDLVSQVIIRRMRKAGIKQGSLDTLRHTHASHLLSRGMPLPAVSARLGHCDTNVTARIYSHALPADDQRAADVWDNLIDGLVQ